MKVEKPTTPEEKIKILEQENEYYREGKKKLQLKMDMISEVLKTEDGPNTKIKMIEEVLK